MHLIIIEEIWQFPNIAIERYCELVNAKTATEAGVITNALIQQLKNAGTFPKRFEPLNASYKYAYPDPDFGTSDANSAKQKAPF